MIGLTARGIVLIITCLVVAAPLARSDEPTRSERETIYYRYLEFASYVEGGSIQPNWMVDGSSFWYAEGAPGNTVIWKVDPKANSKTPLFDTARLRQALTSALGREPPYQDLPFDKFNFVEGEKAVKFTVEDKEFILQLDTYTITPVPPLSEEEKSRLIPQIIQTRPERMEVLSHDGRWFAGLKDYNLWLRSAVDGHSVQLTTDGIEDHGGARRLLWHRGPWTAWAPNSLKLATLKSDARQARRIPLVHWLMREPEVEWARGPGVVDLLIVDVPSKRQLHIEHRATHSDRWLAPRRLRAGLLADEHTSPKDGPDSRKPRDGGHPGDPHRKPGDICRIGELRCGRSVHPTRGWEEVRLDLREGWVEAPVFV